MGIPLRRDGVPPCGTLGAVRGVLSQARTIRQDGGSRSGCSIPRQDCKDDSLQRAIVLEVRR